MWRGEGGLVGADPPQGCGTPVGRASRPSIAWVRFAGPSQDGAPAGDRCCWDASPEGRDAVAGGGGGRTGTVASPQILCQGDAQEHGPDPKLHRPAFAR